MIKLEHSRDLSDLMQDYLIQSNWNDVEISLRPNDEAFSSCKINLLLLNQIFQTWFETDEELQLFQIFVYSPSLIPHERFSEAVHLVNLINVELRLGRLAVLPDEQADHPARLQFRIGIDVEGSALSLKQIDTMLQAATFCYELYRTPLAEVVESTNSARRIWQDFKNSPKHLN